MLDRFQSCERGSITVMFALMLTPMIALAGLSLDYGNATRQRSRIAAALQSAVEAAELHPELLDDDLTEVARASYLANLSGGPPIASATFALRRDAEGIAARAAASVKTPLFSMLGLPAVTFEVDYAISY